MKKEFEVIEHSSGCSYLGDQLFMSRDSHNRDDVIWKVPFKTAEYASLLLGVVPCIIEPPEKKPLHLDGLKTPPVIYLFPSEIAWAKSFLQAFPNPIAISVNCKKVWSHLRETTEDKWKPIFDQLKLKHTLLQFGTSDNFTVVDGAQTFLDLPIRMVAACYKVIGHYVGVDTGNAHLMLAVGGQVWIAHPKRELYPNPLIWLWECDRARNFEFSEMSKLSSDYESNQSTT